MPRRQRPLIRDSETVRDASLVVIASEDTYAVRDYFARFRPKRVQFRVLETRDGLSAPQHIIDRLDAYRNEFELGPDDQLWYCGDTDHWTQGNHQGNLADILTQCSQKSYFVAFSNPCIELWLVLHFMDVADGEISCADACAHLRDVAGGYAKQNGHRLTITHEMVRQAVARAQELDTNNAAIPKCPATRIYKILELLLNRESILLN